MDTSCRRTCKACLCPIASIAIAAFVFLTSFGASITLKLSADGLVARCPIMGTAKSLCVDVTGHLQTWRDVFVATTAVVMVGLLVAGIFIFTKHKWQPALVVQPYLRQRPRPERSDHANYLAYLLRIGILNPKIF